MKILLIKSKLLRIGNLIKSSSSVGAGLVDDLTIYRKVISKTRPYANLRSLVSKIAGVLIATMIEWNRNTLPIAY
jgi:hypothetical protein